MSSPNTDDPIRLLHLSDFHFRADKAWDADPVLRVLARFIGKEVAAGLQPDLAVITGDLAFSGCTAEYQLARRWLEDQLLPALGGQFPRKLGFLTDWSGEEHKVPWWQRTREILGHRLHLAGLDSAWMACGDEDRGRLLLGRWQLNQTLVTPEAEVADLRIALLHHPWDYLAEFDHRESQGSIHQHADLLLRGHLHEPQAARYVAPDPNRSCLELAAGCIYESSRYPNAFQWIELWPTVRRARVHFRLWRDGEWITDRNQPGSSQGSADFDLAGQGRVPDLAAPHKPKVPAEYLNWLRERYASVELLGSTIATPGTRASASRSRPG